MGETKPLTWIWAFSGSPRLTTSGVFSNRAIAEEWIKKHRLTGVLTPLPLDQGNYDYAVANGYMKPHKPHHFEAGLIGSFSHATNEHYHYVDGEAQESGEDHVNHLDNSSS